MQQIYPPIILPNDGGHQSNQFADIVLPHNTYGTHVDGNGKTIDPIKELENFQEAGQVLSNIWSETTVDDFTKCDNFHGLKAMYIYQSICCRLQNVRTILVAYLYVQMCRNYWKENSYSLPWSYLKVRSY